MRAAARTRPRAVEPGDEKGAAASGRHRAARVSGDAARRRHLAPVAGRERAPSAAAAGSAPIAPSPSAPAAPPRLRRQHRARPVRAAPLTDRRRSGPSAHRVDEQQRVAQTLATRAPSVRRSSLGPDGSSVPPPARRDRGPSTARALALPGASLIDETSVATPPSAPAARRRRSPSPAPGPRRAAPCGPRWMTLTSMSARSRQRLRGPREREGRRRRRRPARSDRRTMRCRA